MSYQALHFPEHFVPVSKYNIHGRIAITNNLRVKPVPTLASLRLTVTH